MSKPKPKMKKMDNLGEFSPNGLEGSIEHAIQLLQSYQEELSEKGFQNICLVWDNDYESGNDCFTLQGQRLETPLELARRVKSEAKARAAKAQKKAKKEVDELALYQKLAKKFGKKYRTHIIGSKQYGS